MEQSQRREYLIRALLKEQPRFSHMRVPAGEEEQRQMLRSLLNVRAPGEADQEFLRVQDEYLKAETAAKGITQLSDLTPIQEGLYLWRGDITTLACDAIVNAANSGMTGCYAPCHSCIDNCIHTYAGVQLRLACAQIMAEQGCPEETGRAKLTPAFDLPCRYVLHTVGPIIRGKVTERDEKLLASCYRSCLELAEEHGLESVAFCCISTGEFHFPNQRAAEIAVETVRSCRENHEKAPAVVFNVFKELDERIYREILI